MNRTSKALVAVVLLALVACNEDVQATSILQDLGVNTDLDDIAPGTLDEDGPGLVAESDAAASDTTLPTPESLDIGRDLPTPESFMPSKDTHQLTAMFSNGSAGCAQSPEFTDTYEVTIDGNKITMILLAEGFTYSGTINSDGTFIVMDDGGFEESFEGKFNSDWSGEAVNTLTVDGCTTTWDVMLTTRE